MDAVGAGLKRAARIVISLAGTKQGSGYDLNLTSLFTVDCTTVPGRCSLTPDGKIYTEDDSIVPQSMSNLPPTGTWTLTGAAVINGSPDRVQITGTPDSGNDAVNKTYVDTQRDAAITQTKTQIFSYGFFNPSTEVIALPYIDSTESFKVNHIDCHAVGGGTITVKVEECSNAVADCGGTGRLTETITLCDLTGENDDGLIDNTGISDALFRITLSSLSGTVDSLQVTITGEWE